MSAEMAEGQPSDDGDLSLAEVAQYLHMTIRTVRGWANSGRIPCAVTTDGSWLFRIEDVANISLQRIEPGEVTPAD